MDLHSKIEEISRLSPPQKIALKKLGILTIEDLLYHFPVRYGDTSEMKSISSLVHGETAVIFGKISGLKTSKGFRTKIPMADGIVEDETGKIKCVWFNQPYLAKIIRDGALVRIEGKVSERKKNNELYFSNPKIEIINKVPVGVGNSIFGTDGEGMRLYPVYPESRGITSNWIYHEIQKVFKNSLLDSLNDPIPDEILKKYNLPSLKSAMIWIHSPQKENDAISARKRFAFEEIFFIQLEKQKAKREYQKNPAFVIKKTEKELESFVERFPFSATMAQKHAIKTILSDFTRGHAMTRLLEGDVGSGKTAVAATTAYAVITTKPVGKSAGTLQTAYMCPTEILATQHFESFIQYFKHLPIQIALITGSGCRKFPSKTRNYAEHTRNNAETDSIREWTTQISRSQLLKWVANGEIAVVIGTHALIQKSVKFKHLAYAIIDEQHRFGISQRKALTRGQMPTERGTNTDSENKKNMAVDLIYKDLTYIIRQAVFTVRKELGLGHKEVIYQRALEEEFKKIKLNFNREKQIPIIYNRKKVGVYQPDFVIDEKIIVELKALPFIGTREKKQLWQYLKGSEYKLALLINFGTSEASIERVVYESARLSASGPRLSAHSPHLLSMTATPIPRTLALTIYGDLDLTLLDEMPAGRKPVITEIVLPNKREETYEKVKKELSAGRQVYVICPRIDEPDPTKEMAIIAKSVIEEAKRLKKSVFMEYEIGVLHGKLKPKEKDTVMMDFKNRKTQILVATSVVEVGVNVPNATTILIEGAERFGLAQLHQLRGRVIRSNHQAYCYVFTDSKTEKTLDRLRALSTAKNGFELAEKDLQFRGAGELSGKSQWGVSDVAMEALKNIKMVEVARTEATRLLDEDETLEKFPQIKNHLICRENETVHFE